MAFDAYLKIDGIDGESTSKGMEKQIEIESFSWGLSNSATVGSQSGGISSGKANISAFTIVKAIDKASPNLMLAGCDGSHLKSATVTFRKSTGSSGQKPFEILKFTDCMVSSYQVSGVTGGNDTLRESVSFEFGKVDMEYYTQKSDGSTSKAGNTSWDRTKNAKG